MLRRSEGFGEWQKFVRKIIANQYNLVGLAEPKDPNSLQENQMQRAVVNLACAYNLDECVKSSKELFNEFMNAKMENKDSENKIPTNVRPSVYCTAIYHGAEKEWDFIFNLYKKEQNANERNTMLSALTCSRIPWILSRYLKMTFDESSGIKTQDAVFVFKGTFLFLF